MDPAYDFQTGVKPLPNATAVLVLGIVSIPVCCCYGIVSLALGIVALVLASKDLALYRANPGIYSEKSLRNLKAGRVCAIIGLCLGALYLVYIIVLISLVGMAVFTDPQLMQDAVEDMINR